MAHVLMVDDYPADMRLLCDAITARRRDVTFHAAECRDDAEAMLRDGVRPDLALVDLRLPGDSGAGVIELMKGDEVLRRIPVVLYTGFDCERAIASLPTGVRPDHCREKPFTVEGLEAIADFVVSLLPAVERQA